MNIDVRSLVLPSYLLDCETIDDEGAPSGTTWRHTTQEPSSENAPLTSASVLQFNTQAVTLKRLARMDLNLILKCAIFVPIYEKLDFASDFRESRISISKKFLLAVPQLLCGRQCEQQLCNLPL